MKQLKIKDNSSAAKETFSSIPHLTEQIANKTVQQLCSENVFVFPETLKGAESISADQMILQSVNDSYRTSNVMGFLGCREEQLIISSRFSDETDYFFFYLLEQTLDLPNMTHLHVTASKNFSVLDFLAFAFPCFLKAAMRKGLYKEYIQRHCNDANLKGNIDISRHIKENTPFLGTIAYRYRDLSYDNKIMELIRHTIECIKKRPYGLLLLRQAKSEVKSVLAVTPQYTPAEKQKVIIDNKKDPVRHAYFSEYLALQKLCLAILLQDKYHLDATPQWLHGVLFDGAWLWEEYVNRLITKIFHHPKNKAGENGQRLFDQNHGLIYPDFISRDAASRIIADAKYKPDRNIHGSDYLQLVAYMFRFDAKKGYYLYPESTNAEDLLLHLNRGSTYEMNVTPREDIRVIKHGLKIPSHAASYEDFREKMKVSEQEFIKCFQGSTD